MSTTVRHAFGLMSSAGTGKFPAALLTSTSGSPKAAVERVEGRGDLLGLAHVALQRERARADGLDRLDAAREVLGAAREDRDAAPSRANSTAIALPRPVPPPVTSTTWPA